MNVVTKMSQAKNIFGMTGGGSRGSNGGYTGRDGMTFDRDDSASIATRRSAISHFMNRMRRNGIGTVGEGGYSDGGGGEGAEHSVCSWGEHRNDGGSRRG